jgi:microcystin-dependent protein
LVSRTTYARLFYAIGTIFGAGDGSTTFALPDLRAYFIRGWDDSKGLDSGRAFGSIQSDDFKAHSHDATISGQSAIGGTGSGINGSSSGSSYGVAGTISNIAISSVGGTETRPKNIALLACIKY